MTRNEAIAEIQFRLGKRTDLFDEIRQQLEEAQRLLEHGNTLPYFLRVEDASLVVPTGSADVAFPADFLREDEDNPFHFIDLNGDAIYLEKLDLRTGLRRFAGTTAGKPLAYALKMGGWKFYPDRDKNYTVNYNYFRTAGSLASDTALNPWLNNAPDVMIGMAGSSIAEVIAHDRAKAHFDRIGAMAWKSLFGENIMREQENHPLSLGSRN